MIAKGLDFPLVTLVGIVAADMTLNLPDYRSVERTFQLITQMAGRAGRAEHTGRVILQTYDPDHYGIKLAASQDFRAFYQRESAYRRASLYPPFTVIARIVFSSEAEDAAKSAAERAEKQLNDFLDGEGHRADIVKMRARPCPVKRLRGEYRYQVFLKMYFKADTAAIAARMQEIADGAEGVRAELEVNPANQL
jgi:primosomal protein N' (replication factor Y)